MDSIMNQVVVTAICMALSGGLGFTFGKLGLANIKNDILAVKAEIEKVKNVFTHSTPTPAPVVAPTVPSTGG